MGGEKFDTPHPEGYLFGENMDLNFLGNRPVQVYLRHPRLHAVTGLTAMQWAVIRLLLPALSHRVFVYLMAEVMLLPKLDKWSLG